MWSKDIVNAYQAKVYERKDHRYYKGLIPLKLPRDFTFCFRSNSTGDYGPVTEELAVKHFEAEMGVASGRQRQSYGIVTMALKKGFINPWTGIRYDENFLAPTQMKVNFKDLYGYARSPPGLTFVVAYTMHALCNPRLDPVHNACEYNSTQLANIFGSCDTWVVPSNVVFEDHFDRVVYRHSMQPARGHLLHGLSKQA